MAKSIALGDFNLDPTILYLNHGALGVAPKTLWQRVHEINLESERNPIDFLDRQRVPRLLQSRASIANFVAATVEETMVCDNATIAINLFLKSLSFDRGSEIVITDQEYGAYERIWQMFEQRDGCRIIRAKLPRTSGSEQELFNAVASNFSSRTRLLFFSHITSSGAVLLPAKRLCALARENNALSCVDGAHVPGHIPLNVNDIGADCYLGNCHKWLFVPRTAGFIQVREELHPRLQPLIVSWGANAANAIQISLFDDLAWPGTWNWSSIFTIPDAIAYFEQNSMWSQKTSARALAKKIYDACLNLPGVEPIYTDWLSNEMQMFALYLPLNPDSIGAAYHRLMTEFKIEAPITLLNGRPRIRICIQPYHNEAIIEHIVTSLETLIG
jgi:isopenicillin-N epimerase